MANCVCVDCVHTHTETHTHVDSNASSLGSGLAGSFPQQPTYISGQVFLLEQDLGKLMGAQGLSGDTGEWRYLYI